MEGLSFAISEVGSREVEPPFLLARAPNELEMGGKLRLQMLNRSQQVSRSLEPSRNKWLTELRDARCPN